VQRLTESLAPFHCWQVVVLQAHQVLQGVLVWSIASRPP